MTNSKLRFLACFVAIVDFVLGLILGGLIILFGVKAPQLFEQLEKGLGHLKGFQNSQQTNLTVDAAVPGLGLHISLLSIMPALAALLFCGLTLFALFWLGYSILLFTTTKRFGELNAAVERATIWRNHMTGILVFISVTFGVYFLICTNVNGIVVVVLYVLIFSRAIFILIVFCFVQKLEECINHSISQPIAMNNRINLADNEMQMNGICRF